MVPQSTGTVRARGRVLRRSTRSVPRRDPSGLHSSIVIRERIGGQTSEVRSQPARQSVTEVVIGFFARSSSTGAPATGKSSARKKRYPVVMKVAGSVTLVGSMSGMLLVGELIWYPCYPHEVASPVQENFGDWSA